MATLAQDTLDPRHGLAYAPSSLIDSGRLLDIDAKASRLFELGGEEVTFFEEDEPECVEIFEALEA